MTQWLIEEAAYAALEASEVADELASLRARHEAAAAGSDNGRLVEMAERALGRR